MIGAGKGHDMTQFDTGADLAPVRQRLGLTTGAPVFYDVAIEDFREVTQADVDLWLRRLRDLKLHISRVPLEINNIGVA